jgi:predicted NBD/HSP70 family sugar kinase
MPTDPSTAGHLLQLIRSGRARTRKDLGLVTGLARSTIAQRVDRLVAAGYVREAGVNASTGGRPAVALTVDETSRVVLVADLDHTDCRVGVLDLAGQTIIDLAARVRIDLGPQEVLDWVSSRLLALLSEAGRDPAEVCGIGIGVPGPVDFDTGRVIQPPVMPGWHDYPIRDHLLKGYPHLGPSEVLVDNDANVMALGEWIAHGRSSPSLLFIKVANGIGAGIVINGGVYHGVDGAAGEIGHVRLHGRQGVCACGSVDCLAAAASGASLARRLTEAGTPAAGSSDVLRLVHAGDPRAVALTQESGALVGEVLATVISVLNPEIVVVGGDLAYTHEHFMAGLRRALYERLLPRSTRRMTLHVSRLGDRAGLIGAGAMVVERVLAPEAVDARLAALAE